MVVLTVLGSLVVLLVAACWWEARSGRPAWGSHLSADSRPTPGSAARTGRRELGATVVAGGIVGMEAGGDG